MFNHFGICKGVVGMRAAVDRFRLQHDSKMCKWKRDVAQSTKIFQYKINVIINLLQLTTSV